jgi:hypothetical protein
MKDDTENKAKTEERMNLAVNQTSKQTTQVCNPNNQRKDETRQKGRETKEEEEH